MSTCVRKCTFARACNVGANSLNVVSRTFPHFSQSMLTPMNAGVHVFCEVFLLGARQIKKFKKSRFFVFGEHSNVNNVIIAPLCHMTAYYNVDIM